VGPRVGVFNCQVLAGWCCALLFALKDVHAMRLDKSLLRAFCGQAAGLSGFWNFGGHAQKRKKSSTFPAETRRLRVHISSGLSWQEVTALDHVLPRTLPLLAVSLESSSSPLKHPTPPGVTKPKSWKTPPPPRVPNTGRRKSAPSAAHRVPALPRHYPPPPSALVYPLIHGMNLEKTLKKHRHQ
jgi:hypothetical protein